MGVEGWEGGGCGEDGGDRGDVACQAAEPGGLGWRWYWFAELLDELSGGKARGCR